MLVAESLRTGDGGLVEGLVGGLVGGLEKENDMAGQASPYVLEMKRAVGLGATQDSVMGSKILIKFPGQASEGDGSGERRVCMLAIGMETSDGKEDQARNECQNEVRGERKRSSPGGIGSKSPRSHCAKKKDTDCFSLPAERRCAIPIHSPTVFFFRYFFP
jgi:hypothetical protein